MRPHEAFDASQIESLSLILGHRLIDAQHKQVFLAREGSAKQLQHSAAAFIASTSLTSNIVDAILSPHIARKMLFLSCNRPQATLRTPEAIQPGPVTGATKLRGPELGGALQWGLQGAPPRGFIGSLRGP